MPLLTAVLLKGLSSHPGHYLPVCCLHSRTSVYRLLSGVYRLLSASAFEHTISCLLSACERSLNRRLEEALARSQRLTGRNKSPSPSPLFVVRVLRTADPPLALCSACRFAGRVSSNRPQICIIVRPSRSSRVVAVIVDPRRLIQRP